MHDVVISGGGPVGLMLACQLSRRGLTVRVLEQAEAPRPCARAIGTSPPALEIFRAMGLDTTLVARGVPVRKIFLHWREKILGELDFSGIGSDFGFVLSLPQDRPRAVLESDLAGREGAELLYGHTVTGCREEPGKILVAGRRSDGSPFEFPARYAVACDGAGSTLRESARIPFPGADYPHAFLMGDFPDTADWNDEAHVFFTGEGSVESFPLPDGQRRYVLSAHGPAAEDPERFLKAGVLRRCGLDLADAPLLWSMPFTTRRRLAARYWEGRLILAGDAAHLMSPIVGQNLNTGFADAELLALALEKIVRSAANPGDWLGLYQRIRMEAARRATARAALVMRLGASGGAAWSRVRDALFTALLRGPMRSRLPLLFSMMSIPNRNLRSLSAEFLFEAEP